MAHLLGGSRCIAIPIIASVLVACGGSTTNPENGAADASADVALDASPDVSIDVSPDAGADVHSDATGDVEAGADGGGPYAKCDEDTDCAAGLLCFSCCMPVQSPAPGECWRDTDCASDERCADMYFCGCGVEFCPLGAFAGRCVSKLGCCASSNDCAAEETCIYGVCKPTDAGQCWGIVNGCGYLSYSKCQGSFVCACGQDCPTPDVPGTCT